LLEKLKNICQNIKQIVLSIIFFLIILYYVLKSNAKKFSVY